MTYEILLFVGGVGVLYFGAEWLVRGASRLAASLGVSPIVVGLTVVSMGTSAPELVISVVASLGGSPDLAVGNVMGSNLANVGLVLGISAILRPLRVSTKIVTREVGVMVLITALLLPIIWDLHIDRFEGALLVTMLVLYLTYVYRSSKKEDPEESGEYAEHRKETDGLSFRALARDIGFICLGVTGLVLGAFVITESALALAEAMGVSELVIGLTLVSVGTSLPELATCAVAALRDEADIAVGNILGSNIFNITFVLGITSIVSPLSFSSEVLRFEYLAVMAITVMMVLIVRHRLVIRRREGFALLGAYVFLLAFALG
ncbi:MAG: calcium/sodium antiporter [Gemmatimonadetes bacterium]|nr:calcium/sodium antiporter [Gemmatimonadota bacterium]